MSHIRMSRYERRHPYTLRSAMKRAYRGYRKLEQHFDALDYGFLDSISTHYLAMDDSHSCIIAQAFKAEFEEIEQLDDDEQRSCDCPYDCPSPWAFGVYKLRSTVMDDWVGDDGQTDAPSDFHSEWHACGFIALDLDDNRTLTDAWRSLIEYRQRNSMTDGIQRLQERLQARLADAVSWRDHGVHMWDINTEPKRSRYS